MDSMTQQELDIIIEKSADNIVIANGEGVVIRTSPNTIGIYGIAPEDMVGQSVYELERQGVLKPSITRQVLEENSESQIMQQTLTGRAVMAMAFPIRDETGKIVRVVSFSRDHSDLVSLQQEYSILRDQLLSQVTVITDDHDLNFRSRKVRDIINLISRIAEQSVSVILQGESGSGKTFFARYIHNQSNKSEAPFIEVNCGAIPDNLFESEMFGYAPGSFTGALKQGKKGLIESADGGTLFLDEVGELPVAVQAKLLKVLQDREVTRVGSTKSVAVDFRLITATNRNLEEMVNSGGFRLDLFYRINVIPIYIPALRERTEDIAIIAEHIISQLNDRYQTEKALSQAVQGYIVAQPWPGNIRELENYLERIYISDPSNVIDLSAVSGVTEFIRDHGSSELIDDLLDKESIPALKTAVEDAEQRVLSAAAIICSSTYELAKLVDISQPSVFRKLKKYGISLK